MHKAKNRHSVKLSNTVLSLSIIFCFHQLIVYTKIYMKFVKPSEGHYDLLCGIDFPLRLDTVFSDAR